MHKIDLFESERNKPPTDKYNIMYLTMFAYGFSFMLPWNSVLNSFDYLMGMVRRLSPP